LAKVRRQRQHLRHVAVRVGGARANHIPVRHVLLGRPTTVEERRRQRDVQSDGRLVGHILHHGFDHVEDECIFKK